MLYCERVWERRTGHLAKNGSIGKGMNFNHEMKYFQCYTKAMLHFWCNINPPSPIYKHSLKIRLSKPTKHATLPVRGTHFISFHFIHPLPTHEKSTFNKRLLGLQVSTYAMLLTQYLPYCSYVLSKFTTDEVSFSERNEATTTQSNQSSASFSRSKNISTYITLPQKKRISYDIQGISYISVAFSMSAKWPHAACLLACLLACSFKT
jgi:hypothetical protein